MVFRFSGFQVFRFSGFLSWLLVFMVFANNFTTLYSIAAASQSVENDSLSKKLDFLYVPESRFNYDEHQR